MGFDKAKFPRIILSEEMITHARQWIAQTQVNRTVASKIDTLAGHLGEFAFAEYFFGDWRQNNVGKNKGESDFDDFEIKTSVYPLSEKLNLLVREDYAEKRHPKYYVQIIIDTPDPKAENILPDTSAYICGFATSNEVLCAPLKDFGSKLSDKGGYRCRHISIAELKPIALLKTGFLD